jgi:8-oxo-dGTP pyrophosphatase MutT (NUDIX family)
MSGGGNWTLPKGHIEPAETARETALREAWEEAGLSGRVEQTPVGTYRYQKYGRTYAVSVFVMHVSRASRTWPESGRRLRCWVVPASAHRVLSLRPLRKLVRRVLRIQSVGGQAERIVV